LLTAREVSYAMSKLRGVTVILVTVVVCLAALPPAWAGSTTAKVPVKEDVAVWSGVYADRNQGSEMCLYAGTAGSTIFRAYLKFDLSTLPKDAKVTHATLTVWSRKVASAGTSIAAHGATDDWSDMKVTWNTAPPPESKVLAKQTFPASINPVCCTWDVTDYVAGECEGDKVATLVLSETSPVEGSWVWFADSIDGYVPGASLDVDLEDGPVGDVTPPTIDIKLLKDKLWPPNHEMVLCATVSVSDDLDKTPKVEKPKVSNSERPEANGSDENDPDVEVKPTGDLQWEVWLRAERTGTGEGRQYVISVNAEDANHNASKEEATVVVPHDQGKDTQKGQ
jgi:hypothetical protein